jgi:hypothetical protein
MLFHMGSADPRTLPPGELPTLTALLLLAPRLLQRTDGGAHLHLVGVAPGDLLVGQEIAAAHDGVDLRLVDLVVGTKPMTPAIEPHIEIASSLRSSQ